MELVFLSILSQKRKPGGAFFDRPLKVRLKQFRDFTFRDFRDVSRPVVQTNTITTLE